MQDKFNYTLIPERIVMEINHYVENGSYMNSFLDAVFAHDLFRAVELADQETLEILPTIVCYVVNKIPMACHGSYELINSWRKQKRQEKK